MYQKLQESNNKSRQRKRLRLYTNPFTQPCLPCMLKSVIHKSYNSPRPWVSTSCTDVLRCPGSDGKLYIFSPKESRNLNPEDRQKKQKKCKTNEAVLLQISQLTYGLCICHFRSWHLTTNAHVHLGRVRPLETLWKLGIKE